MKKILAFVFLLSFLNVPLFAQEDLFNPGAESGNKVEAEPDFKPFHPTDALLIGGNGPFNPGAENSGGK